MSTQRRKERRPPKPVAESPPRRVFATNRRATYDYEILETYEAGLALWGTEIKSIRAGKASLQGAYAYPEGDELWLLNMHIPPYAQGGPQNHLPTRPRKLLLHRRQIEELAGEVERKRLTIIPLRLYLKHRVAKVALGLGRGKRRYEKRETLVSRAMERDVERELKRG